MLSSVQLLAIGVVVATCVAIWPASSPRCEQAVVADPPSVLEHQVLMRRVAQLERRFELLAARSTLPQASQPVALISATRSVAPPESATGFPQLPGSVELTETLDSRLRENAFDTNAGRELAGDLTEQLAQRDPTTRVEHVECTAKLCKIVLEHESPEAQQSLDSSLKDWQPISHGITYVYEGELAPYVTTAYLERAASEDPTL